MPLKMMLPFICFELNYTLSNEQFHSYCEKMENGGKILKKQPFLLFSWGLASEIKWNFKVRT